MKAFLSILPAIAVFFLATPLQGQTKYIVSPRCYTSAEGSSNNVYPFGAYSKWTYQQIHDDVGGRPRLIRELAFRIDGMSGSARAGSYNLTLSLSSTNVTSKTVSRTFASNHGKDLKVVLSKTTINWPTVNHPARPPAKFNLVIPFPKAPFLFKNTKALCWEVRIHSRSATVKGDSAYVRQYPLYSVNFGSGCMATGQSMLPLCNSFIDMQNAKAWKYYVRAKYLAKKQSVLWFFGTKIDRWGGLKLPLDLSPFGAKGCTLYTSIAAMMPGVTDSKGAFTNFLSPVSIPYTPLLFGGKVYSQMLSLDPGKSPLPVVFSCACENIFHPFLTQPLTRLYTQNDDQSKTARYIYRQRGLVTRFGYF